MQPFKSNIVKQIETIPEGRIFTFADITFPRDKFANMAGRHLLLTKEPKTNCGGRGGDYKPKTTKLGWGELVV